MYKIFAIMMVLIQIGVCQSLNIAISDFEAKGIPEDEAYIITDRIRAQVIQSQQFRVMERSQMDEILQEQSFQASGACDTSECQVEMGKLLGIEQIWVGHVGQIGHLYTLSAKVLDVETGEIVKTASVDTQGEVSDVLQQAVTVLVEQLIRAKDPQVKQTPQLQVQPDISPILDNQTSKKWNSNQNLTRFSLFVLTGVFGVLGYLDNQAIEDNNIQIRAQQQEYNQATSGFAELRAESQRIEADLSSDNRDLERRRNIYWGLAGTSLFALSLTWAF